MNKQIKKGFYWSLGAGGAIFLLLAVARIFRFAVIWSIT